ADPPGHAQHRPGRQAEPGGPAPGRAGRPGPQRRRRKPRRAHRTVNEGPVDKDKLLKRLMATFLEELRDHVSTLNDNLLSLEKEGDGSKRAELLQTLFRTAHSLKGAARSVSQSLIEGACHQLEEILTATRDGTVQLEPALF